MIRHALLALLLLASGCARIADRAVVDAAVVYNVTLLDGRGGAPMPRTWVRIEGGRIAAIGRGAPPAAEHAAYIDGRGGWLLPGFVDMHAHLLTLRCEDNPDGSPLFDRALSERALSLMLDFGITTIRSPANPTADGLALRDDLNRNAVRGPFAFGSAELINDARAGEEQLRSVVRDALVHRPDFIKVYSALPPQSVRLVIEEAHRNGLPVIGHLQRTSWAEGITLGIDQLTHAVDWSEQSLPEKARPRYREAQRTRRGFATRIDWLELFDPDDPAIARLIAELAARRIPVDPTLVAYDSKFSAPESARYRRNPRANLVPELLADWTTCSADPTGGWTESDRLRWQRAWPKMLALVRRYHEAGVLLTTGTDYTNPWVIPGESLHQEFELLAAAGISNLAILKMSGANAAEALRSPNIGIVEPGRRADLVLLTRNPLADIRNSRSIAWVMRNGQIISRGIPASRPPDKRFPAALVRG